MIRDPSRRRTKRTVDVQGGSVRNISMIQIHSQTTRMFALFDIRSLTVPATTFLDAGGGASTRIEN